MHGETEPLTLMVSRDYKADLRFKTLPLQGYDIILGMPWLHNAKANINCSDKSVHLEHRGRKVIIHPSNPVVKADFSKDPLWDIIAAKKAHVTKIITCINQRVESQPLKQNRSVRFNVSSGPARKTPNARKKLQQHVKDLKSNLRESRPAPSSDISEYSTEQCEMLTARQLAKRVKTKDLHLLFFRASPDSQDITLTDSTGQPLGLFNIEEVVSSLPPELADQPDITGRLTDLLKQHARLINDDGALSYPEHSAVQHSITLEADARPKAFSPYRLSPPQLRELTTQLSKLLAANLIRPSSSPWAAPVLFAPKKDGGLRMCIDYRALNKHTIKDKFPLPHPEDLFDRMQGSKYFTKIDLLWGYWQVRIKEDDRTKSAFVTQYGQFEWNVMPFGMCNAPSTFQRHIAHILRTCINKGFVVQFIDDICIHSKTIDEHFAHVSQVLDLLTLNKLRTKLSKCSFFQTSVDFLGHVISQDGIAVDPAKTAAIEQWPTPTDAHELRSFLGLANYYRRFINGFAEICLPLFPLLAKGALWVWDAPHTASFDMLKDCLTHAPVLACYQDPTNNPALRTVLVTDASAFALGGVLMQGEGANLFPVAFYSRKFSSAERNDTTREQELLAIKCCLSNWRHYLQGPSIEVYTDHDSLRFINSQANLTGRLARWFEFLQEYNIAEIKHVKGVENVVADALSRRPDYAHIYNLFSITYLDFSTMTLESDTFKQIREAQTTDTFCSKIIADLLSDKLSPTDPIRARYTLGQDNTLHWLSQGRHRLVVPPEFRSLLLSDAHDAAIAGHLGVDKTYSSLAQLYYWPNMHDDVQRYVSTCDSCQTNKPFNRAPPGLARPVPIPELPFLEVGLDFVGPLTMSRSGNNSCLTITDYSSRTIRCIPCASTEDSPLSGEATAHLYFQYIFRYHGLPKKLRTDRGSQFTSNFFTELCRLCGTKQAMSTSFHPESQGLTEHANKTIIESLRHYLQGLYETWDEHLVPVEFAYNHSVNPSLGCTPFECLYGFNPRTPSTIDAHTSVPAAAQFLNRISSRVEAARDNILKTQLAQAQQIDKRRSNITFKEDDLVLLSTKHLNLAYPSKFTPKYLGPFKVTQAKSDNAVRLDLPRSLEHLHPVFSTNRLRPYHARDLALGPSAFPQPPPAFTDNDEEYFFIELIMAARTRRRRGKPELQYRIRWVGYGPEYDTWLKADFLRNEPGGPQAIHAWRTRMQSIPAPAATDRAARHRGGVDLDLTPAAPLPRRVHVAPPIAPPVPPRAARAAAPAPVQPPVPPVAPQPAPRPRVRAAAAAPQVQPERVSARLAGRRQDIGVPAQIVSDPVRSRARQALPRSRAV
mmetsp:Transcript_60919/g.125512  ORF Transcript_60919/g.125512 Transcript_60919/m.125512 type:complete len:1332 (-) Transcript_60919:1893-5888(-)